MALRSLRGRHGSRLGHARLEARRKRRQQAGSPDDLVEESAGRAVVEAADERQQDQRNGHDDVRVAVKERRDHLRDPSRARCPHGEHGGPAPNAAAITVAAVESKWNTRSARR
jgi:hypothetical protein